MHEELDSLMEFCMKGINIKNSEANP